MAHITTAVTMLASPPQIRLSRKLPGLPSLLPLVLAMANQLWHRINGKEQGITSLMISTTAPSMRYHYQGGNITGDEVMAISGLEARDPSRGGIEHGLHRVDNAYG